MTDIYRTIDEMSNGIMPSKNKLLFVLSKMNVESETYLFEKAREISRKNFENKIYLRGLIEFSNYCKNDCLYCGIQKSNSKIQRYRLDKKEILECCEQGRKLGFRTFVLQSGEDAYYSDKMITDIVYSIKEKYDDCAVTLSIGEKSYESYLEYFKAGADRYLLRHETSSEKHYAKLHPETMKLSNRKQCLNDLKEIGYQVGCGIMVGSPYQSMDDIVEDILFMNEFQPHMIGIGPFIPHKDTPFRDFESGSVGLTLTLLGILRLLFPKVLLPATTALGTLDGKGREKGILAGANVLMPNLSPVNVRKKYLLYDNKICTGEEAAECNQCLRGRVQSIGYTIVNERGDYDGFT